MKLYQITRLTCKMNKNFLIHKFFPDMVVYIKKLQNRLLIFEIIILIFYLKFLYFK
jgi:hypothetical protein